MQLNYQSRRGFTLVEMMVAVSIFAIVSVIATGALLTADRTNKKAQAIKLVMDNLNFALDSMTLKMKQGGGFYCDPPNLDYPTPPYPGGAGNNCPPTGGTAVAFSLREAPSTGGSDRFIYRLNSNHLEFSQGSSSGGGMSAFVPITADEVTIDMLHSHFYVLGMDPAVTDANGPRVLISLNGQAKVGHESQSFAVETIASAR